MFLCYTQFSCHSEYAEFELLFQAQLFWHGERLNAPSCFGELLWSGLVTALVGQVYVKNKAILGTSLFRVKLKARPRPLCGFARLVKAGHETSVPMAPAQ